MAGVERKVSVLLASPHAMSRELLMAALSRHRHFQILDSATTADEMFESIETAKPDVALISATLADGPLSGFGALRRLRESSPEVKAVLLFYNPERNLVVDAFRAGARGVFCLSESNFKSLCRCVEQVYAGQIWANSSELTEVIEAFTQLAPMRIANAEGMRLLTKREEEVVQLLTEGMQNREIAQELKLSEHTIKNYLFHIFDKLGVSSRVELVLYAVSSTDRTETQGAQRNEMEAEPTDKAGIAGESSETVKVTGSRPSKAGKASLVNAQADSD